MSEALNDLLARMREHPAFPELLRAVKAPEPKDFKPVRGPDPSESAEAQRADWILRSGMRRQDQAWRQFLTEGEPSQQEKS